MLPTVDPGANAEAQATTRASRQTFIRDMVKAIVAGTIKQLDEMKR